jgi:hypothetical protein
MPVSLETLRAELHTALIRRFGAGTLATLDSSGRRAAIHGVLWPVIVRMSLARPELTVAEAAAQLRAVVDRVAQDWDEQLLESSTRAAG